MKINNWFIIILLVTSPLKANAAPHVTIYGWEGHANGRYLEAEVSNVEIGSTLIIEKTKDLTARHWIPANAASQVVERVPTKIAFFVSNSVKREFFRVVSIPPKVTVKEGVLVVSEEAPLD